jgi:hypothetical protein
LSETEGVRERQYLTVYDYGMRGVWTFIVAPSPDAITEEYPELEVVPEPPQWMIEHGIKKTRVVHLSDVDDSFLAALRAERPRA